MAEGAGSAPVVAMVLEALYLNGATRVTLDLARLWRPHGMEVLVRKRLPAGLTVDVEGLPVRFLSNPGRSSRWSIPAAVIRLAGAARHCDVVVVSGEIGYVVPLAWLAAKLARRPFVVAVHADLEKTVVQWVQAPLRPLFRAVHRRVDGAIAVEKDLIGPLERNGLPPSRIRVVRNGVDVEAVRRAARAPDPLPEVTGPRVVVTGRLAPEKATDVMIRAHARTVASAPHTLVVLNDGPEEQALRALADSLGVAGSVRFVGRTNPHPFVARADLFCLPSRHEGLPLALLEAMAVGTPVVAARCSSGVTDALDDGRLGALVPVDDAEALARVVESHLTDPAPLRAKAAAALREIERFTDTEMAAGWVAAIDDFVDAWRRRQGSARTRRRDRARW